MSEMYKVRLKNGDVLGPLELVEVVEAYFNEKMDGSEEVEKLSSGELKELNNFPEIKKLIQDNLLALNKKSALRDSTLARIERAQNRQNTYEEAVEKKIENRKKDIEELEKKAKKEEFKEFKYTKNTVTEINYEDLEKNYKSQKKEKSSPIEKTLILSKKKLEEVEKTKILSKNLIEKELKEKERLEKISKVEKAAEETKIEESTIDIEDKTKVINLKEIKIYNKEELKETENKIKKSEEELKNELIEKNKRPEKNIESPTKETSKKKKKTLVLSIIMLLLVYLLLDEEEKPKGIDPKRINFSGPVTKEKINKAKAREFYEKGMENYYKGTYKKIIRGSEFFKKSLEENFKENKALGMLIRTYSELFPNASNKRRASQILFGLIKIARAKALKDVNAAIGISLFYFHANKYLSALRVIENYLRVEKKPSPTLFAEYLKILIKTGKLKKARKVFNTLLKIEKKPLSVYLAISIFYDLDEKYKDGKNNILEALTKYPSSTSALLELAGYYLREKDFSNYSLTLKKIEFLKAEENPIFYAKFLEYMGVLSAYNKDNKKAAVLFQTALKLNDSDELRSKLATLELGGGAIVEALILESRAIDLIRTSQKLAKEGKWLQSFQIAVEASDINENYIPAQLNLSNLQIKRGYFEDAIKKLEKIRKKSPSHPGILFTLVKAFIASRKLSEAKNLINAISNSKLKNHHGYPGVIARFYYKFDKKSQAVDFLNKSIALNPLNDSDYFLKAEIFIKNRQYKEAKRAINEAINLDPLNIKYRSLYGKILFDLNGGEVAIGYLRDLLKENKENAVLLGDIATYYYKNGQTAQFEVYKERVSKLRNRDADFFRFLIRSAQLENNNEEIIKYSEELLRVEPGDNESRIYLGITYRNLERYGQAIESFNGVINRLKSYPTVHYHLAKVYIKQSRLKNALEAGLLEIKYNPRIYNGHFITGEAYRLQGDIPKATKSLEKAVSLKSNSVESLYSLCWIKRRQNYLELALEYCKRAKSTDPSNSLIRKELGSIYAGIGQSSLAVEEFQTYLKLFPNAPDRSQIEGNIRVLKH